MMNALATFGNLFGPDMIIVFLIMLLLFGAKKLPELARGLGQSLNEFKRAREDFEHEIHQSPTDVKVNPAKDLQARNVTPSGSPTAQELQQQVEALQAQLRAEQIRSQTPQLVETSAVHTTAEVTPETARSAHIS